MTEISTNNLNSVNEKETTSKDVDFPDELEAHHQRFYKAISSHLTLMQLSPKEETVVKIIQYSKFYNK